MVSSAGTINVHGNGWVIRHHLSLQHGHALVDFGGIFDYGVYFLVVLEHLLGLLEVGELLWGHAFGEIAPVLLLPVKVERWPGVLVMLVVFEELGHGFLDQVALQDLCVGGRD